MSISSRITIALIWALVLVSCNSATTTTFDDSSASNLSATPAVAVDVCRCLTDPGNSDYLKENERACRDAISREIGVENWEAVNMSQNPEISARFDQLAQRCMGETSPNDQASNAAGVAATSDDLEEITTDYGYIYESVDRAADLYSTLAFDGSTFRNAVYTMNGETESQNFKKAIELRGIWGMTGDHAATGNIQAGNVNVSWTFSDDYSSLVNNKGVKYERVKVQ
ncbi:MAG: hypothetical protein ACKO1U_05635 [Bacteroidota bacterium]